MPMQATPSSPPPSAPSMAAAYGPPSSGGFGAPPSSGGFGAPPSSGGFGAPPSSGGFGPPRASGGFGAPPSSGSYGVGASARPMMGPPGAAYAQRTPTPVMPMAPSRPGAPRGSSWPLVVAGLVGALFLGCVASGVAAWRLTRDDGPTVVEAPAPSVVPVAVVMPVDEGQSRLPVGDSPVRGQADALVTIVELGDFQCPFTRRVQESLNRLRATYPADVRIAFKHMPLAHHRRAVAAAELALEAQAQQGPEGFWRAHDLLFERQLALEPQDLEAHALTLGLDLARVRLALSYGTHRGRIERDRAMGAELDVTGTPTLFINGRRIAGALPYEEIQRVVDEELARARATLAGGVPRTKLYGVLSATVTPADRATRNRSRGLDLPGLAAGLGFANDDSRVYTIPVPPAAPWRGALDAPVVIQAYGDFECPFTRRSLDTLQRVEQEYAGRLRVVWRHQPLAYHSNAMPAAQASSEVHMQGGAPAFWRYHQLLFQSQSNLGTETLVALAAQVPGIDANRVRSAMMLGTHRVAVQADADSLTLAGVRAGTPIFFINGRMLRGAQPIDRFRALIDAALGIPARR